MYDLGFGTYAEVSDIIKDEQWNCPVTNFRDLTEVKNSLTMMPSMERKKLFGP